VGNIIAKFNRSTVLTAAEDLKVGNIFESKVKLLQANIEWSIKRGVPFSPVKTNKSFYTTIYTSIKERDTVCRNVCPWRHIHLFPRVQVDTSRLNLM